MDVCRLWCILPQVYVSRTQIEIQHHFVDAQARLPAAVSEGGGRSFLYEAGGIVIVTLFRDCL